MGEAKACSSRVVLGSSPSRTNSGLSVITQLNLRDRGPLVSHSKRNLAVLVLRRKVDEVIMIGDDIQIMITKVKNGIVGVGISAPKHIAVHRKEVYEALRAAESTSDSDCD